jgi:aminoglycoside phosphotransferase (APT) family kinase protein
MSPATVESDSAESRRELVTGMLRAAGELGPADEVTGLVQIEGGWSRWSHIATARVGGTERRYVVRVKAPYGLFDTEISVEYELFVALQDLDVHTPRVFGMHSDPDNPFGGELFVMEFLSGHAPNLWRAADHKELQEDWAGPRGIARDAVETLARIHAVSADDVPPGVPRIDYADHVAHWKGVYFEHQLVRDPVLEETFAWLESRVPTDPPIALVHGDYRIGNTLIDGGRLTAVLDWELAYVGDVRFDLGYFASEYTAGRHLGPNTPLLGGIAQRDWFLDEYERLTDRPLDRAVVDAYTALGLASLMAMTAVGIQRHRAGTSTDVRRVWARFGLPGMRRELAVLMGW